MLSFQSLFRAPPVETPSMGVTYFKRYRMEFDLRHRPVRIAPLLPGYSLVPFAPDLIDEHAEAKYQSFRNEIDSGVFECLGDPEGCHRLMEEIAAKEGFLPEATWLVQYRASPHKCEPCATVQGVRVNRKYGAIQNVGVTPFHRGRGIGTTLVTAALWGFQQHGLPRAYLEVTAQNVGALRLYQRLGFRRVKTLYKAVELAYH